MKKENAYALMDELLSLEYDLDSINSLSVMLLHSLQDNHTNPTRHLLNCYEIWLDEIRRKMRNAISLLDEAIIS